MVKTHPHQRTKVPKTWGEEEWIVNTDYCGKILRVKKQHQCSYHHHKNKDETFYVISGKVHLSYGKNSVVLEPGESVRLTPGIFHQFTGLEDSEIIEFSTHHEDSDSHRHPERLGGKVPDAEFKRIHDQNRVQ